ncbi:ATP-binding protein, partial [Streptomyces spectabilis]
MSENVVHLYKNPDEPPEAGPGPTVLTVVPDAPGAPAEAAPVVPLWVRSGRAVRHVVTHERTKTTARAVARHSLYVVGGGRIVVRRTLDARTPARYERMLRAAEAAGNYEVAVEWEERGQRFRDARHRRRMDLLTSPIDAAKTALVGTGLGIGGLVGLGVALALATKDPVDVITPLAAVIGLISLLVTIVMVVWGPLLTLGPFLALLGLWSVGR